MRRAILLLRFYDIDLSANPPPPGSIQPLFTHLGVADSAMHAKPALGTKSSAGPTRPNCGE